MPNPTPNAREKLLAAVEKMREALGNYRTLLLGIAHASIIKWADAAEVDFPALLAAVVQQAKAEQKRDTDLLEVLGEYEWSVRPHREKFPDGWCVWWTVYARNGRNVSGHPQPTPGAAIRSAIASHTKSVMLAAVQKHQRRDAILRGTEPEGGGERAKDAHNDVAVYPKRGGTGPENGREA